MDWTWCDLKSTLREYAAAVAHEPTGNEFADMRTESIPNQGNRRAQRATQLPEECTDRLAVEIGIGQQAEVGAYPAAPGQAARTVPQFRSRCASMRRSALPTMPTRSFSKRARSRPERRASGRGNKALVSAPSRTATTRGPSASTSCQSPSPASSASRCAMGPPQFRRGAVNGHCTAPVPLRCASRARIRNPSRSISR